MSFEIPVTVALANYHHSAEIRSGSVALAGMAPTFVDPDGPADIVEVPLAEYVRRRADGDLDLIAVPVFPARAFVHRWIQVPGPRAGYPDAGGAAGASATVSNVFGLTAGIYARGLLGERGEDRDDVQVSARPRPGMTPLFAAPADIERADFEASGVFPILSVLAIRSELVAQERWLATNVYRAFEVSRRRYFARLQDIRGSRAPIPSVAGHLKALTEVFGPDLWPYGLAAGGPTLSAFLRYCADQGAITAAPTDPAELFADVEPFVDFTDGL